MSEQQYATTVFGETPKTAVVTTALPETPNRSVNFTRF